MCFGALTVLGLMILFLFPCIVCEGKRQGALGKSAFTSKVFWLGIKTAALSSSWSPGSRPPSPTLTPDRESAMVPPAPLKRASISYLPSQGVNTKVLLYRALSPEEKNDIQTGTRSIFFYGRIEYLDVFKKKRCSTYRLHYTNSAWPPNGGNATMNFCDTGNETR
jgi:hypothetical protein